MRPEWAASAGVRRSGGERWRPESANEGVVHPSQRDLQLTVQGPVQGSGDGFVIVKVSDREVPQHVSDLDLQRVACCSGCSQFLEELLALIGWQIEDVHCHVGPFQTPLLPGVSNGHHEGGDQRHNDEVLVGAVRGDREQCQ